MPPRQAPVHYLRANEREWTPAAVIFADTETLTVPGSEPALERLNLWCAHYLDRRAPKGATARDEHGWGRTADSFAEWVDTMTRNRESVWMYTHNLGFDLTTTRLLDQLHKRGWSVSDAAIGGKAPWVRMVKGKRRLALSDSFSWLPIALGEIGDKVQLDKPELPEQGGDLDSWLARCRGDVAILEKAILTLMEWWQREQLGNWTISGAACGWNAYRHIPTAEPILVDPDPDKVRADRLAVHGGRRGVWAIGAHAAGPFLELDITAAYPTVAATLPLPVERVRAFTSLPVDDPKVSSERWSIAANVKITTDVARWPVRIDRHTWYPVGRFTADLAGPDIREAQRLGCLAAIGSGYVHKLGRNMAPWARWVLALQNGHIEDTPEVAKAVAKSWGRMVIGKWAARGFEKTKLGPSPGHGWGFEEAYHHYEQVAGGMVDIAGERWLIANAGTPDNAYPAILAWVEAEVRSRLNRVIEALGPGAILQCDTDGLVVIQRTVGTKAAGGHLIAPTGMRAPQRLVWCMDQLDPVMAPLSLRVKRSHAHVTVLGPQHLRLGAQRRFAGLPGDAEETAPGQFTAKLWPGLKWQMEHGSPDGYVRPTVTPRVDGPYPTGWILSDARVVPVECEIGSNGENRIIPWHRSRYAKNGIHRADVQHPVLDGLI